MIKEIEMRRSIRKYSSKPVEDEKINELLESARLAPSGNNTQPWHYIVVKSEEMRRKIVEASHNQKWMFTAPVFIVCVADIRCRIKKGDVYLDDNSPQDELKRIIRDTSISTGYMLLEANNLGLGVCWVAEFTQEEIRPVLNIPSDKYVVGVLTIGYPDETPKARPRKRLEDMIHYESWE
ncbi:MULTISPECIES: nitroreductase family protein [Clostridium]|uniref:Nitroreductase n=1 Tax=Clostridium beijerinckii TaxID=1520 RepID=A0A1S9N0L7_CLOBE|nr:MULTISPECIES: nitroreductase family protein [Clostridium]MBN7575170.1 nitroreductase family protein [Clostridium beijerinckii]MBN7580473.1 nitroreductase family protein [Clostridium beijerinckii]MBN7584934.1 nitroreductase family protein [Clostridium beijerinckii]MBO0520572.1 nitroreductase family protein [Clostridium beijerinckii]MZK53831.1 nitroreductase [Clostridium beijerinckii]